MKRLSVIIFALAFVGAAWAGEWHIENVDYIGSSDTNTSLKLDTDDLPFISWHHTRSWTKEDAFQIG